MWARLFFFLVGAVWVTAARGYVKAAVGYHGQARRWTARWYAAGVVLTLVTGVAYMVDSAATPYCLAVAIPWIICTVAFEVVDTRRMIREHKRRMAIILKDFETFEKGTDTP